MFGFEPDAKVQTRAICFFISGLGFLRGSNRLPLIVLFRLQILLLPIEASRSCLGKEPNFAFPILYFPVLSSVVELDFCGSMNFEPSEFMERNSFCP